MRRLGSGTRSRLVVFSVVILGVANLIADGALLASLALSERSASDSVLVAQARVNSSTLEDSNGRLTLDRPDLPGETHGGIAVDAAVVAGQTVVAQTAEQPLSTLDLLDLASRVTRTGGPRWADVTDSRGVPRRAYATALATSPPAVLVVSRSVEEMETGLRRTFFLLLGVSSALILIGALVAYWLAGRALRPVRVIAGLARSISDRDLHRRVEVKVPPDELGELVDTFNSMLERLEASFNSLGRFTADASHELRAPLALMRSELDGALAAKRSGAEYRRVLETMNAEVDHLTRLSDQLLMLARADAGALVPARQPVDVADFLHETAARWEGVARQRNVGLEVDAPDSGRVSADLALLRRVLDNLLDNALRKTAPETKISLRAHREVGGWTFEVADRGPGVPVGYRGRLFTRFARPDMARSPDEGGAGLGLALSAAIVDAHGGSIELVSQEGPGATFRVILPDPEVPA